MAQLVYHPNEVNSSGRSRRCRVCFRVGGDSELTRLSMSKSAGLAVSDEDVVETILRMLRSSDNSEAASLLRTSRWRFEQTGYDNWNGGTWTYTLYLEIAQRFMRRLAIV